MVDSQDRGGEMLIPIMLVVVEDWLMLISIHKSIVCEVTNTIF